MRQRRPQRLLEHFRRRDAAVPDRAGNAGIVQVVDEIDDAPVLGLARGAKFDERAG